MKKYLTAALTLIAAIALLLAGMYVYSRPENEPTEPTAVKNITVESVTLENRRGGSCYVLRDTAGTEYVFSRLPDSMRGRDISGRIAEVRYAPVDGVKRLRELSVNGETLFSELASQSPAMAHVLGAVIITGGFLLLWLFVNIVTRPKNHRDQA